MGTEKPFLTYEGQLEKLKNKGLVTQEEDVELLKECSYFSLISGYKALFKKKDGNYKPHTTLKDIYALYEFDHNLRSLFLQYIFAIEIHIKSLMSYAFCTQYGEEQLAYLNTTNYDYTPGNQDDINEMVSKFKKIIQNSNSLKQSYIVHHRDTYGNVPLWVLLKALTMGSASKMYSYFKQPVKQRVSKEFQGINENELVRMVDLLSRFRNVCAHNERLYDYKYRKHDITDTEIHKRLKISKTKNRYCSGKNDLFAVVIVFKLLLKDDQFEEFKKEFKGDIDRLFSKTRQIQNQQLFKQMGLPPNWEEI